MRAKKNTANKIQHTHKSHNAPVEGNPNLNYAELYLKGFDKIIDELNDIKNEVSQIKHQTTILSEKINDSDFIHNLFEVKNLYDSNMNMDNALKQLLANYSVALNSNTEMSHETTQNTELKSKKNKIVKLISNILFYSCMALLIIGALSFAQNQNPEKSILGYRYYYIKTSSMEPVLPVGSVILTKVTSPENIRIGDDITVFIGDDKNQSYLTHRVVEVIEDVSGEIFFRTKGVNNKSNDETPFNSKLVVGKVVLCIPILGTIMLFVQSQLIFIIVIFILMLALSFMLRLMFTKEKTIPYPDNTGTAIILEDKKQVTKEGSSQPDNSTDASITKQDKELSAESQSHHA